MSTKASALSYPIRARVVLKHFGQICVVVAALMLVPPLMSLVLDQGRNTLEYALTAAGLAALGITLARVRAPRDVQVNEALVLTASVFLIVSLLGAIPFAASGLPVVDAVFESVSAVTTTGLSTLATVEDRSASFLFARAWAQWYGGLGMVVFSLALVVQPGLAAKRLTMLEAEDDDLVGNSKLFARRVLGIYCLLTSAGFLVLWLFVGDALTALDYVCAAVSTGGFAPHDASLAALGDWPVQVATTLICISGAVSLSLYHRAYQLGWRQLVRDVQLRGLLTAGLVATVLLGGCMRLREGHWAGALRHAPLLGFSAQTTTGFASTDVAKLDAASKLVLIGSMSIGAGMGSTAGGIKLLRVLILLRLLQSVVRRTCMPRHAVLQTRLGERRLEPDDFQEAALIALVFLLVIALSWLPFLASGYDPLDALFEVVSATGTVGLSTGVASPELPTALKLLLCADMLMGRLEIIAWLVVMHPGTWIGKRAQE